MIETENGDIFSMVGQKIFVHYEIQGIVANVNLLSDNICNFSFEKLFT